MSTVGAGSGGWRGSALWRQGQAGPGSKGGGGGVQGQGCTPSLPAACSPAPGAAVVVEVVAPAAERKPETVLTPPLKAAIFVFPPENALRQKLHTVQRS